MHGDVEEIARLIQMAVAPVFLLTAVATTLMMLAGRLSRIVDRGRAIEAREGSREELDLLERRAIFIYRALCLGVSSAILVSLLMAIAFMGQMLGYPAARAVALLFIGALFAYTGALICLLREVFLAIGGFRLGLRPARD